MGKFVNGINGPVIGKVGNIIGSNWRGIPYVKSRGLRTKPPTEGEKLNRFIFKMTQSWLQPINDFLRVGFKGYSLKSQGIHAAKSYLHKNALIRNGYDTIIDPSLMKVSFGTLPLSKDIRVELNDQRELVFTWNTDIHKGMDWRDQVMMLAYNIDNEEAETETAGQFRNVGSDKLEILDRDFGVYHIYAAFVSCDRERQSDSIYLGEIVVDKVKPEKTEESKGKALVDTKKSAKDGNVLKTRKLGEKTELPKDIVEEGNILETNKSGRKTELPQDTVEVGELNISEVELSKEVALSSERDTKET